MAELEYSIEALNAKGAFHRVRAIVYVEGDDDHLFWEKVLSAGGLEGVRIESVGGSTTLDKYISDIEVGKLFALVARDADFLPLFGNLSTSPMVLYTFGYSIENTLYTPATLQPLAKTWSKSTAVTLRECEEWLNQVATAFARLLHLDIANGIAKGGVPTLGDNCTRFMTGSHSATPCAAKISAFIAATEAKLTKRSVSEAERLLGPSSDRALAFLRGHFLASAVMKFLVCKAKACHRKVAISSDALYATAMMHFSGAFGPSHPHFGHYAKSVATAARHI